MKPPEPHEKRNDNDQTSLVFWFEGLKYFVNDRLLEDVIVTVFFVLFPTNNPSTYFFSLGWQL